MDLLGSWVSGFTAMNSNYHTQHAPFGAFASFTLGLHHRPGGFGQALGAPARQNLYIGWRRPGQAWKLLPFFESTHSLLATFTGEEETAECQDAAEGHYVQIAANDFERKLGWATDTWKAGPFSFCIYTPFEKVPDPRKLGKKKARRLLVPAVVAKMAFDNREGSAPVELIFGMNEPACPMRPLRDTADGLEGFATRGAYGYATVPSEAVRPVQALSALNPEFADPAGLHRIGQESALIFRVPAGERAEFPLALGFFEQGPVTTGLVASYYYTTLFDCLEQVLLFALGDFEQRVETARMRDAELASSKLKPDQQFLVAQATHSYYGSTELLIHEGEPLWVVNEGEYRMMNTFDLTVDHLFFELQWHPWAVRDVLDLFVRAYSYEDTLHSPDGKRAAGGISFTHDMGVANQFTPRGFSSYECYGLTGCFSHMTSEQLVNWVCCAVTYAIDRKDLDWLAGHRKVLMACAESLRRRDHPEPALRDGLIKWDSDRCGPNGSEITTYDSLDVSLGQARNNLYLGVKTLAAWLLLEEAFKRLGRYKAAAAAGATADLLVGTLVSKFDEESGFFPAVFEAGNQSRILPAVEGLVFPLFLGMRELLRRDGRLGPLLERLERHMKGALVPGICIDAESLGWKISSTSHNTWMSKIALAQFVTRQLFPEALSQVAIDADQVHADWERGAGCGPMAMCDQINSRNGQAIGSKYYPRCVTTVLWLRE